jgi:hypothetical protein
VLLNFNLYFTCEISVSHGGDYEVYSLLRWLHGATSQMTLNFDILLNFDLILNCFNYRTLYFRRWHLYALFIIDFFKIKINFPSIADTWHSCETRQIREFSAFSVTRALTTFLQLDAQMLRMAYADFWASSAKTVSPLRTFYWCGKLLKTDYPKLV